jgi:hypothetical protein
MYLTMGIHIKGTTPTIMHNSRLANPVDPVTQAIKEISGKRKKTDTDLIEMSRLEFLGGLYLNEDHEPCWPGENIEAMLIEAAKKDKLGRAFRAGLLSNGLWPLEYVGPKNPDELWKNRNFVDVRPVRVQSSRIMRTRPIFREWQLNFEIQFLPELISKKSIVQAIEVAGFGVGLSDFRPKYGKFIVEGIS